MTYTAIETLAQWLCYWMENYIRTSCKPAGYAQYKDIVDKHIIPAIGDCLLVELSTGVLQQFLNEQAKSGNLKGGGLSAKSIKNMRVVLDVALKAAVQEGYLARNPVAGTVIRKVQHKGVTVIPLAMQKELEVYLFGDGNLQNIGILLSLYTGCRLGEICALQWKDVDFVKQELHLEKTVKRLPRENRKPGETATELVFSPTKGRDGTRVIAAPPLVMQLIQQQKQRYLAIFGREPKPEDYVVYNTFGNLTDPDNLGHYYGDIEKKLGLTHYRFHDLRHTFATRAIEHGMDVLTLSGMLGHANVATTQTYYLHPNLDAMHRQIGSIVTACGNISLAVPQAI